ncbi:integral membrane protein [Setomelanomma holmii]|uniref:Integral membrane protein n=1 Tax=Setomelanomma holmii TaxID=210430 RepID=A0A9P4H7Q7_9PLEO|nr:integral membrane protein [Setomelanomma holmii]
MTALTPLARVTIVLSWLLVGLAGASTLIQLFWLWFKKIRFSIADGCVCAALLVGLAVVAQTTWAIVDEGSGKHQSDMVKGNIAAVAKSLVVNEALWSFAGALIRVAGSCLLCRIFGPHKSLNWIFQGTLVLCVTHGLGSVLEVCLICRPLAAQWDPNVTGVCGSQLASFAAIEISGLILDLVMLISPVPAVLRMRMNRLKQIKAIIMLDIGAIVLVVTCLRLKSLQLAVSSDFTYSKSYLGLLSASGCMLSVTLCGALTIGRMLSEVRKSIRKPAEKDDLVAHGTLSASTAASGVKGVRKLARSKSLPGGVTASCPKHTMTREARQ